MTDREKLIELLVSAESAFYWDGGDKGFVEKIADHLIANGVMFKEDVEAEIRILKQKRANIFEILDAYGRGKRDAFKWIPVTERLPEKYEKVLALTQSKMSGDYNTWLIWYTPQSGFHYYDSEWGDIEMDDVTHWMPLPEQPEGE